MPRRSSKRVYDTAERRQGRRRHAFRSEQCLRSPLPRAYQWADGSAYVTHVELVRKARGAEMPPSFWTDPLMYQGGSDGFHRARAIPSLPRDEAWGIDFEGEVAVITGDVPMGCDAQRPREAHPPADAGERRVACAT